MAKVGDRVELIGVPDSAGTVVAVRDDVVDVEFDGDAEDLICECQDDELQGI